jgi:RNA-binding protein
MNKQDYKPRASLLESSIRIGKAGIEQVVPELKNQLKVREMVKVKFLKSAFFEKNKSELCEKLGALTGSELIEVRGNTAVFRRKG